MKLNKVERIIELEWNMFQKVENIGGRASCQEDFETFYIMRRSQYENWTDEMLDVWTNYVLDCEAEGRNLLSEKYARMMQYSDLHYYNKHLKHKLPTTPYEIGGFNSLCILLGNQTQRGSVMWLWSQPISGRAGI